MALTEMLNRIYCIESRFSKTIPLEEMLTVRRKYWEGFFVCETEIFKNFCRKYNIKLRLFQIKIPLRVYAETFSGQLHFQRGYFFTVGTYYKQALLQNSYSPKQHWLFSEDLFLQLLFRTVQSVHFSQRLLFKEELLFQSKTLIKQLLLEKDEGSVVL